MKISKLFHWLYAFVMFLPILAVGSTVLISTFNMSSKEESQIHYKYQTNEVNNVLDLVEGNIYKLDLESQFELEPSYVKGIYLFNVVDADGELFDVSFVDNSFIGVSINDSDGLIDVDLDGYFNVLFYFSSDSSAYVIFDSLSGTQQLFAESLSISEYNDIESVETHNVDSKEVFYASLDELKESPYFSWAYNSFLSTPIVYIVGLFSMPTNHVIVELLSYWLAISIIWLVFDLIMYVPLLVHRWLDKGVLE